MTSYTRMKPEERKRTIVLAAVALTRASWGYEWSKDDVAHWCLPPCGADTVKHYFTKRDLVKAVDNALACG